jgi:hypothetical protein
MKLGTLIAAAAMLLVAFLAGSARAAENLHVFDPTLSLTGNCSTSIADPVADPGCPGSSQPPSGAFAYPSGVEVDSYGNIYVGSVGQTNDGSSGRIDIFDSAGRFITELPDPAGPQNIALDSDGNLYVANAPESPRNERLVRYAPSTYEPATGNISYDAASVKVIRETAGAVLIGLAVDQSTGHLYANYGTHITEYGSAAEGNVVLEDLEGVVSNAAGGTIAIDQGRGGRIYATGEGSVLILNLASPHTEIGIIDGSTTPTGHFVGSNLGVAVDEATGHVFVFDGEGKKLYEFTAAGEYVSTIEHSFQYVYGSEIAVDNGAHSLNGALNSKGGYVFVPSNPSGTGHLYAFGPATQCPPEANSISVNGVTEREANLQATINPCGLKTSYVFEYTTQGMYEEEGFTGASVAGSGEVPAAASTVAVAVASTGLTAGETYVFRIVVTNEKGSDEASSSFRTYPPPVASGACPNDLFRVGFSAPLPDCRAYELVSPADTNGRSPQGVDHLGTYFETREASPTGDKVSFEIEGGSIRGYEATGSLAADPYLSVRTATGWTTSYVGPSGLEAPALLPGSTSPDQGYSFWSVSGGGGTAALTDFVTNYVRYPDGHSALVGRGSFGTDPIAGGILITENGSHIVFASSTFPIPGSTHQAVQLEPEAPENTSTIYDRTADEVTHVVSLLPGNVTPAEGQDATFQGASKDGRGIAFEIGGTLYLRVDDAETFKIGENASFAGVAEGGHRVFYLQGGNLLAFDVASRSVTHFSSSGNVVPVNISADGSTAYFVSQSVLTQKSNPHGVAPLKGAENLYQSREGDISFVGRVLKADVGEEEDGIGLGLWVPHVASYGESGEDPSRTTPGGDVLLFESRAPLTSYNPQGHDEVYRYDSSAGTLGCLSCNPTGAAAAGGASLVSITQEIGELEPFSAFGFVPNLRPDGNRAFFQSTEALVTEDTDGLQDVYEWEANGVGGCDRQGGCVYLISSGHSARPDYLYGVDDSGDNVFFRTADRLLPSDAAETPSIYDARVGGGFLETGAAGPCEGEACHPGGSEPPELAIPQTLGSGSGKANAHCRRGRHQVRRHGKVRCVKRHHHHHGRRHTRKGAGK